MITRKVLLDGRTLRLRIDRDGPFCRYSVEEEGEPPRQGSASIVPGEPGVYSVLIEGASFEVKVSGGVAWVRGREFAIEIQDPRRARTKSAGGGPDGPASITAAMPGKVVRVLAAEGEEVEAGKGIVVVEAMKMQNEIRAPKAGRVTGIRVAEGAAVNTGDLLAVVE